MHAGWLQAFGSEWVPGGPPTQQINQTTEKEKEAKSCFRYDGKFSGIA
jgi:hypothetical protein